MEYAVFVPDTAQEEQIDDALMAYTLQQAPPTQKEPFVKLCRCAKSPEGELIGGILACSVLWNILRIEALWVKEECRGNGIATALLAAVEEEAVKMGCSLAQLDTYDFQALGFYEKCGYTVFGTLPDAPKGHTQYFLCKRFHSRF